MSPEDVAIIAIGMTTAVGLTAQETAVAVRSATMRFRQVPARDHRFEPFTVAAVPDDGLVPLSKANRGIPGLTPRDARRLRLASSALDACRGALPSGSRTPPAFVAEPEYPSPGGLNAAAFLDALSRQCRAFDLATSASVAGGRAGSLAAIGAAADAVRRGARFAIAGGVDSYYDLYTLGCLDREHRVKSTSNLDGFIPGEAAGFLVLATVDTSRATGVRPVALVASVSSGSEVGHLYSTEPYKGEGLAKTVAELLASRTAGTPIADVFSSMNGESHWAKEWGVTHMRNRDGFVEPHTMQHPADCYGETGAAAGPLLIGLAALGIRAGHRAGPALVYCSSDRGLRAATVVTAVG